MTRRETIAGPSGLTYIQIMEPSKSRMLFLNPDAKEYSVRRLENASGEGDHQFENLREVTELYEGPLDQSLFEPPADYRRVLHLSGERSLPWSQLLQLGWEWIEDSFGGLFG